MARLPSPRKVARKMAQKEADSDATEQAGDVFAGADVAPAAPQNASVVAVPSAAGLLMGSPGLAAANINPATGLASDYLNHFNEAIMLLEMAALCPDCLTDLNDWQPLSYREHFQASRFKGRELAIAAYEAAAPATREYLETLADTMNSMIEATRASMATDLSPDAAAVLAERAAIWLKLLVARAGAVINGGVDARDSVTPQAMVDQLMARAI